MLCIVGTVPDADFPLVSGPVHLEEGRLAVADRTIEIHRGTPALVGAVLAAGTVLHLPPVEAWLVGDIGRGEGSRRLYAHLEQALAGFPWTVLVFHYLQPDVDWHNRVLFTVEKILPRPVLIADAGFMYAAKMSGQAESYDLFTPDVGELAFLADEEAPHPFYTRGFILHQEDKVAELIDRTYTNANAARWLLVKGRRDCLADARGIRETVDTPASPAMEAMGGTGDTLTGLASALAAAGMPIDRAAILAARANRLAGQLASPTPATQIEAIVRKIPMALKQVLDTCGA
ncbi:NAD(P)H-hydrate dehydratase [uncultured Desulfosarcina sp.]|uniref:NAD(P)H-hydrate dehydratase n=1 Tax=uncultured Desulfosarcina sp. TaxID=218289 RepID=UPI0029C8E85D|nr:NAD(P)H-hydrate dehydratase [uncultured Desulfosarcina sp.]